MTKPVELSATDWLRALTNSRITAQQIAAIEGCEIRKARSIVVAINKGHIKGADYVCDTDKYLAAYRHTSRKDELRLIYGEQQ